MKSWVRLPLSLSLAALAVSADAQERSDEPLPRFSWLASAGLEFGGDDVAVVYFENGETETMEAGEGITLAGGGMFRPNPAVPFGISATLGYKVSVTSAENADFLLDRWVLELMANHRFERGFWGGIGAVRHMNVEFDADGLGENVSFDDANGFKLQLGWKWVALSYTDIEYTDEFGFKYDASSFGILATTTF